MTFHGARAPQADGRGAQQCGQRRAAGHGGHRYELPSPARASPSSWRTGRKAAVPRGQHWNAATGVNPDNVNDPGYGGNGWTAHDAHPQAEFGKIWLTPFTPTRNGGHRKRLHLVRRADRFLAGDRRPGRRRSAPAARVAFGKCHVPEFGRRRNFLVVTERQLLHRLGRVERKPRRERAADQWFAERDHDLHAVLHGQQQDRRRDRSRERRVRHGRRVHRRRRLGNLQPPL